MTPVRDRRTEILTSAARLFAVSGFHGVSIDDLGAEIGVSGPSIYRYFVGKDAILSEMLVDISRRLLAGATERVEANETAKAQLSALIGFHVDFAVSDRDLIAVQYRDLGNAPDRERRLVRQLQRSYVALWVDVLLQLYPKVKRDRAERAVRALFGLLNSTPYIGRGVDPDTADLLRGMAAAAIAEACQFR